uniref:Uncharacterized protein n=1 Tax=Lepeophtheirus salmonis TaxID=72036 RepID=A0A0K2ULG7_LEPSM
MPHRILLNPEKTPKKIMIVYRILIQLDRHIGSVIFRPYSSP